MPVLRSPAQQSTENVSLLVKTSDPMPPLAKITQQTRASGQALNAFTTVTCTVSKQPLVWLSLILANSKLITTTTPTALALATIFRIVTSAPMTTSAGSQHPFARVTL